MPVKVLHVSEAFGGGVVTAIMSFVKHSPWIEHHLLMRNRKGAEIPLAQDHPFGSVRSMPASPLSAIRSIRRAVAEIEPDFVHLHSSFAGAYGRLGGLPRQKIIYSPHCFAFENHAQPWIARGATYIAEQILSLGGARVAGVSRRECDLGVRMIGTREAVLLPNVAMLPPLGPRSAKSPGFLHGAMVGRLSPQKDPSFLIATAQELRARQSKTALTWIGGGKPEIEAALREAGIEVTGWMTHEEAVNRLREMSFYVHCAAWEGNPMSILEAAALGLPIVARDIPSLRSIGMTDLAATPQALAAQIVALDQPQCMEKAVAQAARLNSEFGLDAQREALRRLYGDRSLQ